MIKEYEFTKTRTGWDLTIRGKVVPLSSLAKIQGYIWRDAIYQYSNRVLSAKVTIEILEEIER